MCIRICKGGTMYWKMNQGPNTLIFECYYFQNSSDGWHVILYSSDIIRIIQYETNDFPSWRVFIFIFLFINSWGSVFSYFVRNCKCLLGIHKEYKGLKTKF
jgi:hypothetical protein